MRESTVREMYTLGQDWPYPDHPGQRAPVMGTWCYEGQAIRFVHDLAQAPKKRERQPGSFGLDFGQMVRHPQGYWCAAPLTVVPGDAPVQWDWQVPEMIQVYGRFPADVGTRVDWFLEQVECELDICRGHDAARAEARHQAWCAARDWRYPKERDQFQPLPWTMADLCGSTWRNIHVGSVQTVQLGVDRFGDYILCHGSVDNWLGLWDGERYCIDHDVRVDHLPPDVQLRWWRVAYTRCQLEVYRARQSLVAADQAGRSHRWAATRLAGEKAARDQIETQARAWAREHGLEDGPAWQFFTAGLETRPQQLSLF